MTANSPESRLAGFIAKFTPEIATQACEARDTMRALLPGAIEMVYDNYNALVIGFGPTERPSEAIFSLVVFPRRVSLCFIQGAKLRDPAKRLQGKGNQVRHIVLTSPADLDEPVVRDLMTRAIEASPRPFDETSPGKLIIRSVSAKQRPRRPGG